MQLDDELELLEAKKKLLDLISDDLKQRLEKLEGGVGRGVRHKSNCTHRTETP